MTIIFNRPLFGVSTKTLYLDKDGEQIGEMKRWLRPTHERPATSPRYDVNIKVESHNDTYEITQESFSLRDGHCWSLKEGEKEVGQITSSKGFKSKHQIEVHSDHLPHILIRATWKGSGIISINDKEIGETKAIGFLINQKYLVETEEVNKFIDPSLLAGIAYTFWLSHTRG